jgi:hypothetical protein
VSVSEGRPGGGTVRLLAGITKNGGMVYIVENLVSLPVEVCARRVRVYKLRIFSSVPHCAEGAIVVCYGGCNMIRAPLKIR